MSSKVKETPEALESYRPLLFAIAYQMTGSASEAEDLVEISGGHLGQDQLPFARWSIASVVGRPDAYHPFVMIEDAAQAVVAALEHAPADIYDIVEDERPTTEEINAAMAKAVGRRRLGSCRASNEVTVADG